MDFIKRNYEKVLLGLVLLGLVVAAVLMLFLVANEKEQLANVGNVILNPKVDELPPPDMSNTESSLKRASVPAVLNFADNQHKLFNPVTWGRTPDGRMVKIDIGNEPKKLEVIKFNELYLKIGLKDVQAFETGPRYGIIVEQQAAAKPNQRGTRLTYASLNEKKEFFTIRMVEGPADNPTNIVVELNDTNERISVGRDRQFQRVEGYTVDLKYPPENKTFPPARRKDDTIFFAGETYKIASITKDAVVLSAQSNQKKWTIKFNPTATPEPR